MTHDIHLTQQITIFRLQRQPKYLLMDISLFTSHTDELKSLVQILW